MTKFNLKLKLISIIIFILTLILLYFIYKFMNSYVIVNENFNIQTTKETYELLQKEFTDSDFVNKNNIDIATYDSLKTDYSEYIDESVSVSKSLCKQKQQFNNNRRIINIIIYCDFFNNKLIFILYNLNIFNKIQNIFIIAEIELNVKLKYANYKLGLNNLLNKSI